MCVTKWITLVALACLLVLFPFFFSGQPAAQRGPDYDLLICHGKIVDGAGNLRCLSLIHI